MLKNIFIIACLTISNGYQSESAIATEPETIVLPNQMLLGNSSLGRNNPPEAENLTRILIFAGLISVFGLAGWQLSRRAHSGKSSKFDRQLGKSSSKALIDRVSPKLRRQLLRLINDPKTANRLLMGIYKNHRDRHPDWIAEKAIYDLRRGR